MKDNLNKNIPKKAEKPAFLVNAVNGRFFYIKQKFNNQSHASQELLKWKEKGWIINYRIAWDTKLRMTVEVVCP